MRYYLLLEPLCPTVFLNAVFAGEKILLKRRKVKTIEVPKYKELCVKKVMEAIVNDAELIKHLPDLTMSKKLPDRDFLFNIINSLRPEYMESIIDTA